MKRCLRDQRIVILLAEPSRALQCTREYTHCLKLGSAITDAIFIDRESLHEEFVGSFFEAALVSDLAAGNEETETQFSCGWVDARVELDEGLVEEAVEG